MAEYQHLDNPTECGNCGREIHESMSRLKCLRDGCDVELGCASCGPDSGLCGEHEAERDGDDEAPINDDGGVEDIERAIDRAGF